MKPISKALSLSALLCSSFALSDQLEQTIVSASHQAREAAELSSSVTVIDAAELAARTGQSAFDILRLVPSLQISRQGGAGGVVTAYLRGGEPNFTTVLVDGLELNDPTNSRGGSFDFAALEMSAIERIEVVRGPHSVLSGAGSLAGLINIITRPGSDEHRGELYLGVGTEDLHREALSVSGPISERSHYAVRVGQFDSGEQSEGHSLRRRFANARLTADLGKTESELVLRYADTDKQAYPEDSGGPLFAPSADLDDDEFQDLSAALRLRWEHGDLWSSQFRASRFERQQDFFSPGVLPFDQSPPRGDRIDYSRTRFSLGGHYADEEISFSVGLDSELERGVDDGFTNFLGFIFLETDFRLSRTTYGQYAELAWRATDNAQLDFSVRHHKPESQAGRMHYRLGYRHELGADTTLRLATGTGIKLPSFFALGNALVGNPELKPEQVQSVEVGLEHRLFSESLTLGFEWYRSEYENLIDFDEVNFINVNRDKVVSQGGEFQVQYALSEFTTLRGHMAYLDIDLIGSTERLRGRPQWTGAANLLSQLSDSMTLTVDYLWNHHRLEAALPFGSAANPNGEVLLPPYSVLNASLQWNVSTAVTFGLSIRNLLDEEYQEAVGFPSPGTEAMLTLRWRFL